MAPRQHASKLSEIDGGWGAEMGPDLMFQQLEEGHDLGPDNIALVCQHQSWGHFQRFVGDGPSADCLTWTYRQMMKAAKDLALLWMAQGVKSGDTVVAFLPSSAEWALGFWMAVILDLTFVPLDSASLNIDSPEGHAYPLELFDKPLVVLVATLNDACYFDQLYSNIVNPDPQNPPAPKNIRLKMVCHEQGWLRYNDWTMFEPSPVLRVRPEDPAKRPRLPDPADRRSPSDRVALVLFTQESPDHPPKGCKLTVENIRTAMVNQAIDPHKRYLITCLSSSSATLEAAILLWKRGGSVVFSGGFFDAAKALAAIQLRGCTRLICTPSHLEQLINDPSRPHRRLETLESLTVHGGVVNAELLERGQNALQTRWASFSMTMAEGLGVFGWAGVLQCDRTLDSVGTVMGGSRAKICHIDDKDHVLDRGQEGLLHIGGDAMIAGYLGGVSTERFYQDPEGKRWFITSYLATMDRNRLIRPTAVFKI